MSNCSGCNRTFESYEMSESDAYEQDGKIYCNSDCAEESETNRLDSEEWLSECWV